MIYQTELDGRRLYYMFVAGAKRVIENQTRLNSINVFPVNDGDTGTNMAATLRSVVDHLRPERSYKLMVQLISETTLMNARGNSGIIFAQFLYGMSRETIALPKISIAHFAESLKKSVGYVYKAMANPVEGTMLTIIRVWADFVDLNKNKFKDFSHLFTSSKKVLEKSLAETKSQLKVLEKANVVDAGANAFYYFIEGIIELIKHDNIRELVKSKTETPVFEKLEDHIPEHVQVRYCTEAIIRNLSIDHNVLADILKEKGDSVVIAGDQKMSRLHVHTDNPIQLFDDLKDAGTITFQKVDDMLRQSQVAYNRKWKIALVTDSTCDLPDSLIDEYQIHILPINIYFGENHFLDRVTIRTEQFYNRLQAGGEFPKTSQVNETAFRNLYSHLASYYDAIISVHLTGKFSGTYHNSLIAAELVANEFNKPITVIDSKNISGALGLIVLRIAQSIERGEPYEQIIKNAEKWIADARIFVSVKTLKYMVRGGRVSALKGFVARILNVKPIVSMDEEGKSLIFGKAYSQKANMEKVIRHIKEITGEKRIWKYIVLHANNPEGAECYERAMKSLTAMEPAGTVNISPVVGSNAGLGAASVAFIFE